MIKLKKILRRKIGGVFHRLIKLDPKNLMNLAAPARKTL